MGEILFLAHRAPWPPDRGDRIRSWHMFEALRRLAPVHVAALADSEAEAAGARLKFIPLSKSLCIKARSMSRPRALAEALLRAEPVSNRLFYEAGLARHVETILSRGSISHIVGFSGQMAQYIPAGFDGRVVMDFVDVDSAKFEAYAAQDRRQPLAWIHAREARLLGAMEARVARAVDASLFVSDDEAELFRKRSKVEGANILALGNGIDTDYFDPAHVAGNAREGARPLAVFTGQMDYRPNIEAVTWFAREILPKIRARRADARFAIVGRAPSASVRALGALPGVSVTGEVPDVRPWLAAADVVVAPLLLARGVQNKLLEALAMARPVVATPAAATGIDLVDGRDFRLASAADDFALAVEELMSDSDAAAAMGRQARARMIEHHGWDARLAPLADLLGLRP